MDVSALTTAIGTEIAGYSVAALAILTASMTLFIGIKVVKRVFNKAS